MIRILYVTDSLMAGGIESQLVELVSGLNRDRFEPSVLSLYGPHARALHFAPHLHDAGIPLLLADLGWGTHDKVHGVAAIVHAAHATRAQLIQAEGYHANLLARMARPFLSPSTILLGSLRGVPTSKQMRYERFSHRACRYLVTNALHLKADLVERGHVPARKIVHIPNGIQLGRFRDPHDPRLRQQLAPNAHRVVVSLGRISLEKNMHWLVTGVGLLKQQQRLPPGVRVFIVGPPHHDEAQALLTAAIHRHALEDIVIQHPETQYPMDYYYACDLSALFSPAEGMPNVALESLAAGKPVLLSDQANRERIIVDGQSGWVAPAGNIDRLAEKLAEALTVSDGTLAHMRIHCLNRAKQFSVQRMITAYERLYDEALS